MHSQALSSELGKAPCTSIKERLRKGGGALGEGLASSGADDRAEGCRADSGARWPVAGISRLLVSRLAPEIVHSHRRARSLPRRRVIRHGPIFHRIRSAGTKRVREGRHGRARASTPRAEKEPDFRRERARACPRVDARPYLSFPS